MLYSCSIKALLRRCYAHMREALYFFHARLGAATAQQRNLYVLRLDIFYLPLHGTCPLYSNSLAYSSLSDMLLLQCPQGGCMPSDRNIHVRVYCVCLD